MIDAQGTVVARDGDHAIVRMDEAGCGRCHEEGGCGGNNLGKMLSRAPRTFRVLDPGKSAIGDCVTVVIAEGVVRRSAISAYGLPLLVLFLGAIGGSFLAGETGAILGSLAGLLCSWMVLRYVHLCRESDSRFQPFIKY